MRPKLSTFIQGTALMFIILALVASANAQAPTLQEQLAAQYKLVKMGADSSGPAVVEAGTILAIQKGGILGFSYDDSNFPANNYKDGSVHAPGGLKLKIREKTLEAMGRKQTTRLFQVGEKVYPSKIDVDAAGSKVTLTIIACDSCNNTDPKTFFTSQLVFQFAAGSLAKASAGDVEDTIAQLLSVSSDDAQQSATQPQQASAPAAPAAEATAAPAPQPAAAPPEKGTVNLTSVPDKAEIYVDDNLVGMTPAKLPLVAGKHTVKISKDGYDAWTRDLTVLAGAEVPLTPTLVKTQRANVAH